MHRAPTPPRAHPFAPNTPTLFTLKLAVSVQTVAIVNRLAALPFR